MPSVSAQAEYNTNRQLDPAGDANSPGYRAVVEGYLKRNTQRTLFFLHPQVSFQEYPDIGKLNAVEGMLELETSHRTVKGTYNLMARYTRQDTLNAEYGKAGFDTVDPEAPDTQGTGFAVGGVTRNRYEVQPSFSYSVTQRVDLEGDARVDSVKYESDLPGERVGYTSPSISMTILRDFSPRLKIGVGPYYDHYESDDNINETNSYGANVDFRYQWSEITRSNLVLSVEKDDITEQDGSDSVTTWGVRWLGQKRNRVGLFRYSIGRLLQPSSIGSRARLDQVRVQWVRPLSPRMTFDVAARYTRLRSIGTASDGTALARNRGNADMQLRTQLTETITLGAGYRFAMIDRINTTGETDNHGVFLALTYMGRDRNPEQR